MSVWIYARVSTFDQYVNGYSVDQQVRSCLEYAKQHNMMLGDSTNCDLPGVFIDGGKSAFKKKLFQRPGGNLLMQNAKPGDTIIALATHRLFRQFGDMVAVMDKWVTDGVNVRFVDYPTLNTDTANGKAMLYIMAVMAQLKSELISARVKEAKGLAGVKQKPEPPTPKPTIMEKTSKDLGAVMQQMQVEREKSKFTFNGRVHAYVRVSTKDQTVDHQIEMIKKQIPEDMKNSEIIWYSDEGASAFKTKFERRKAGGQMLQALKPGDMVVAWRPDRLFRSLIDASRVLEKIHATGASLTIVEGNIRTDQAQGRMLMQMMSMFAEMESQDISRMTKLGHFGSIGVNPAARAVRMPKLLRSMKKHHLQKYYQFEDVLTPEERFYMHIELSLTQHNYRDRRTACRVISNKYLAKKGLAPVSGEFGDLVKTYVKRLKNMQKVEFSTRRQRLIDRLKKEPDGAEIRYPLNVSTIAWIDKRQKEFLRVAKMFPGRLRDKQALTMLASSCASPEAAVAFVERVR
jgi:DNA invertase Pin-like site-specific DNA recombinase